MWPFRFCLFMHHVNFWGRILLCFLCLTCHSSFVEANSEQKTHLAEQTLLLLNIMKAIPNECAQDRWVGACKSPWYSFKISACIKEPLLNFKSKRWREEKGSEKTEGRVFAVSWSLGKIRALLTHVDLESPSYCICWQRAPVQASQWNH